ncbi:MAG: flagellar hook-length control protein FliK [Pseudomonadota bacterium]
MLKVLTPVTRDTFSDALKLYLPKQQDFSTLANHLLRALQSDVRPHAVPEYLKGAARSFLHKLPDLGSLSNPTALAAAVRRSGIFFEAQLAGRSAIIAETDLKASLLRFLNAINKTAGVNTGATAAVPASQNNASTQDTGNQPLAPDDGRETPLADAENDISPPGAGNKTPLSDTGNNTPLRNSGNKSDLPNVENETPQPDADYETPLPNAAKKPGTPDLGKVSTDIATDNRFIETLKKTGEGVLAKLVLDQLASLPKPQTSEQIWQLTLPFIHEQQAQSVKLAISREPESDKTVNEGEHWSVVLELHPPGLGTVRCRLAMKEASVDTRFWCDREPTARLLADNLEALRLRYQQAGLDPGRMASTLGLPQSHGPRLPAENLLDERA